MWVREFEGYRKRVFDYDEETETEEMKEGASGKEGNVATVSSKEETAKMPLAKPSSLQQVAIESSIEEIIQMTVKAEHKLNELKDIIKGKDPIKLASFYCALVGSKQNPLMYGEWMERKMVYILNHTKGRELEIVVNAIKEVMRDLYPNIPIYPTEAEYVERMKKDVEKVKPEESKSSTSTPEKFQLDEEVVAKKKEYKIKSHKGEEGKMYWACPHEGCGKAFPNMRTADSCLNAHLGLVYDCPTCEFVLHNYDSARNHRCFAYRRGEQKRKGGKVKRSVAGKDDADVVPKKVKVEEEEEDEDIIVLD